MENRIFRSLKKKSKLLEGFRKIAFLGEIGGGGDGLERKGGGGDLSKNRKYIVSLEKIIN